MMCPGCGAPMSLDAGKDFLACRYCGTTHFPDPNPDQASACSTEAIPTKTMPPLQRSR